MYYFRYFDDNHLYIDLNGKDFDSNFEQKIRVQFTTKDIITIFTFDEESNMYPIKKSAPIRRVIFDHLTSSQWNFFQVDGQPIEGISNEDGELVSPLIALFPHVTKKIKPNPYAYISNSLIKYNLPDFNEEHIIKKQVSGEYIHIYYRVNSIIYHICFNQFEKEITQYEIFNKIA